MATIAPVAVHNSPPPMTLNVSVYGHCLLLKLSCPPLVHALLEDDHVIWSALSQGHEVEKEVMGRHSNE